MNQTISDIVKVTAFLIFIVLWVSYRVKQNLSGVENNWTQLCAIRAHNRLLNVLRYVPPRKVNEIHYKASTKEPDKDESQTGGNYSLWKLDYSRWEQPLEVV